MPAFCALLFLLLTGILDGCRSIRPRPVESTAGEAEALPRSSLKRMAEVEKQGLRVLINRGAEKLLRSGQLILLLDRQKGEPLAGAVRMEPGRLAARDNKLILEGKALSADETEIRAENGTDPVSIGGRRYRGRLYLKASGDDLLLINAVTLDQYLYGVLPSEVPENWPMEALKAQALAARTYALVRAGSADFAHYDVDDSTQSQVYMGTLNEGPRSRSAVDATHGLVVAYKDKLAETFFYSNCGGHSADSRNVWGRDIPYLQGVEDPYCKDEPHFKWKSSVLHAKIQKTLQTATHGLKTWDTIDLLKKDGSGRWTQVRLSGVHGEKTMASATFRMAAGPNLVKSTNFEWHRRGDKDEFKGFGWGHGVGLCQEGSKGMADQGYRFRAILAHYFPGTQIRRLTD